MTRNGHRTLRKLFEPTAIRDVPLRNRIAMCAMNDNLAFPDGYPSPHEIDYYEARAAGGVGLIISGNAFIDDEVSKISSTQIGAHDNRLIPGLARLVEAVHGHGTAIVMQLAHAGTQTLPETIAFRQTVAPSATLWEDVPRELTVPEIEAIIASFVAAAWRAERSGFDGAEIHCAHGYLLSDFLSPRANRRTDAYGGSAENRMRIVREIIERTRRAVSSRFLLGAKINSSDLVDGGLSYEDGIKLAKALEAAGVDYIAVSRGVGASADEMIAPLYYPRHQNIAPARRIREAVSIPVIAMGAVLEPEDAEEILVRGDADLVAIGRALIADPDWPTKARHGRSDDIRPCIRCNECVALVDENHEVRCAVNPEAGREATAVPPATQRRTVLVLGGGPAGCETARVAAGRGHEVVLIERRDRLGGASVPRGNPEFKRELDRLPLWYAQQLERLGVDIRLGREADRAIVDEIDPDVVVYALGATPYLPPIRGIDGPNVIPATTLLEEEPEIGQRVAVLGAGFVGCEVAVHLGRTGKHTILVTRRAQEELASDLNDTLRLALLKELDRAGVEVLDRSVVDAVKDGSIEVRTSDGAPPTSRSVSVDAVVLAQGFVPQQALAHELIEAGYDVRMLGDTIRTGLIFDAVQQGYAVGRAV